LENVFRRWPNVGDFVATSAWTKPIQISNFENVIYFTLDRVQLSLIFSISGTWHYNNLKPTLFLMAISRELSEDNCKSKAISVTTSRPGRFTAGEKSPKMHWIGGWVGPRTDLDNVEKKEFFTLPALAIPRSSSP
jgi:hypothetical protein